jgi:hypothetical protein
MTAALFLACLVAMTGIAAVAFALITRPARGRQQ